MENKGLAIIGSGPTAIYCLRHILENAARLSEQFSSISIYEKGNKMGFGMPYNPHTTDKYNLSNISSEEIPKLPQTFAGWLRKQTKDKLIQLNITSFPIKDSEVYSRIALGEYFHDQFKILVTQLRNARFEINEFPSTEIIDIEYINQNQILLKSKLFKREYSKVIISTGHQWKNNDEPTRGYYAAPWPIQKIRPKQNTYYNYEIGILGASLSAFDVVSTLAHRHGKFIDKKGEVIYQLNESAKEFKITLHALEGWLPHLQYEQVEPFREIYRHTSRKQIFSLINNHGNLRIDVFFNRVCRPALINAFEKDNNRKLIKLLTDEHFNFAKFIETMANQHEYVNSFEGMRKELVKATDSIENNKPIHWMETLDDLMYCLNFHSELMPAEDHLFFNKEIKPFLMSVIAALPLKSAKILLALYDAKCINLITGKVNILDAHNSSNETKIEITKDDNSKLTKKYKLFINCSGNDNVDMESYPFQSLVKSGIANKATAMFESNEISNFDVNANLIEYNESGKYLKIGGVAIDSSYQLIDNKGQSSSNIYDLSFTHHYGCRPYSYGLQACNATGKITIESWLSSNFKTHDTVSIKEISKIYNENEEL